MAAEDKAVETGSSPAVQAAAPSDAAVAAVTPAQPTAGSCSPAADGLNRTPGEGDNQPAGGCVGAGSCGAGGPHCIRSNDCTGPHDTGVSSCNGVTCFAPYTVHYYTCACDNTSCQGGNCKICPADTNTRFHCAL
jgi:hypothetical protein